MKETEIKKVSETNNALAGFLCLCMCFMVGFLMSLTGIGAIIGIPLMIAGFGFFLFGVASKKIIYKGKCPTCDETQTSTGEKSFKCSCCKRRIIVGDKFKTI